MYHDELVFLLRKTYDSLSVRTTIGCANSRVVLVQVLGNRPQRGVSSTNVTELTAIIPLIVADKVKVFFPPATVDYQLFVETVKLLLHLLRYNHTSAS